MPALNLWRLVNFLGKDTNSAQARRIPLHARDIIPTDKRAELTPGREVVSYQSAPAARRSLGRHSSRLRIYSLSVLPHNDQARSRTFCSPLTLAQWAQQ